MRKLTVAAVLAAVLSSGCGSVSGPAPGFAAKVKATVSVKGRVTYRGKPLTHGKITLEPTDGGREARGEIAPDGSFTLGTFAEGDGALIGVHSVSVSGIDPPLKTRREAHVRIDEGKTNYAIDLR
jgi:hypothetical protein